MSNSQSENISNLSQLLEGCDISNILSELSRQKSLYSDSLMSKQGDSLYSEYSEDSDDLSGDKSKGKSKYKLPVKADSNSNTCLNNLELLESFLTNISSELMISSDHISSTEKSKDKPKRNTRKGKSMPEIQPLPETLDMSEFDSIYETHCSVHGKILLPGICGEFIKTDEFNRLRGVKQNGNSCSVHITAEHSRYVHCIGVASLTLKILFHLRQFMTISTREIEIVTVAALLHDIGHMAYSHLFDRYLRTKRCETVFGDNIEHEDRSNLIMRNINKSLKLLTVAEEDMITDIILGNKKNKGDRAPLYEIVNNAECGIDSDKLDYLARDTLNTDNENFDPMPVIYSMVVHDDSLKFLKRNTDIVYGVFKRRKQMFADVYINRTTERNNKLVWCMMNRTGDKVFQYGYDTTDSLLNELFRTSEKPGVKQVYEMFIKQELEHECPYCEDYKISTYKDSGKQQDVPLI